MSKFGDPLWRSIPEALSLAELREIFHNPIGFLFALEMALAMRSYTKLICEIAKLDGFVKSPFS